MENVQQVLDQRSFGGWEDHLSACSCLGNYGLDPGSFGQWTSLKNGLKRVQFLKMSLHLFSKTIKISYIGSINQKLEGSKYKICHDPCVEIRIILPP